ncbi:MAG: ATP-binding protein [Candidatus Paceibacterota bacterium]|jgi:signal transduction histidine kinase
MIDASKIREALLIVIENAIKYNNPEGTINITTNIINTKNPEDIKSTENKEKVLEIIIENTGVGIASKDKDNIFKHLFYRTDKAKTANPTGMGIGLSVARAIVRAHHGELTIESEGENMGAKITIKLPSDL